MTRCSWALLALATIPALGAQRAPPAQASPTLSISAHARSLQPGEVVELEVVCTCEASQEPGTARVFNREIPLAPVQDAAGWSGLIGLDLDVAPGKYLVTVTVEPLDAPPLTATYTINVVLKRFPTRRLLVAPEYVEPPPAELTRLLAEAARLDGLFKTTTWRQRVGPFQSPVAATALNTFGARSLFNGKPRSAHAGADFASPTGTPVAAPAAGMVVLAEDLFFTGQTVILDHGRGLYSVLAHLSTIGVASGDSVERGDEVGKVGATGRATGAHLHWGVRLQGARVDPLSLVRVLPPG